jgi:hypothetical protein
MSRACAVALSIAMVTAARAARADGELPAAPGAVGRSSSPVAGAPCGGPGRPGIVLRAAGLAGGLEEKIADQLRAALAGRGFELCPADRAGGAVAELDVSDGAGSGVSLSLALRDEVTDKRVSREIDLRGIPDDGRALVIAEAADELLRASWAELLIADSPKPTREVPAEVTRTLPTLPRDDAELIDHPAPAPRAPIVELGIDLAFEHYGSGHDQIGPDVSAGIFPLPRLGAVARVGIRGAAVAETAGGSADPSVFAGGIAVVAGALPRDGRAGLDGGAELFVSRVRYEASARPGFLAHSDSGTAVHASVVARGWAVIAGPLRATLGVSLGAPLHTVRAAADQRTFTSVSGALLGATLGVGGVW